MGSPISFSGFNNIDFGAILNLIMQQERAPLSRLETQKSDLRTQHSAWATFATRLGAFQSAVQSLNQDNSLGHVTGSSSNPSAVGVSTFAGAVPGTYEVAVSELARPQVMSSTTLYTSPQDVVATAGTLRFTGPNGDVDLAITEPTTLQQLATRINQLPARPVTASVVQVSPGNFRLVLTAAEPGMANAFKVAASEPLTGGAGLGFPDTNGSGVSGDAPEDNVQQATNAALTVNGIGITSSTNSIEGAIPGVRLNLTGKDPAMPVVVTVAKDEQASIDLLKRVVTTYNDLMAFVRDQSTSAAGGRPSIARDPMIRGLRDSLRNAFMAEYGDGELTRLTAAGLGFDRSGKMVLNERVFRESMERAPGAVQSLFGGANGIGGAFAALHAVVDQYTRTGGLVASARERIDAQVATIDKRLADLENRLAIRRTALQEEFTAADRAMSQLYSQGNSLLQLANQYRLF